MSNTSHQCSYRKIYEDNDSIHLLWCMRSIKSKINWLLISFECFPLWKSKVSHSADCLNFLKIKLNILLANRKCDRDNYYRSGSNVFNC